MYEKNDKISRFFKNFIEFNLLILKVKLGLSDQQKTIQKNFK